MVNTKSWQWTGDGLDLFLGHVSGLPWMRGDWVVKKPEMISVALQLLEQLPKKSALSAEQVSEIQFSELDGFLLTLVKSGQQIRFGTDD